MKIYFYKYTSGILEKSKVLKFKRFQGFWTSTVSMDFSWLYASSSSLLVVIGNILLHVLQLVHFKA